MPLTPSSTRDLLTKLGHQPKRFLGQNFLVDGNIVRKSLELAAITERDTVIEIGPGLSTLTSALLATGAKVWAVEKDRQLHAHLLETLVPEHPRLHLLEGDAMEQPLAGYAAAQPFKVTHPVEANAVFIDMDDERLARLHATGWFVYRFIDGSVRLMCSWATTPEAVDELAAVLRSLR